MEIKSKVFTYLGFAKKAGKLRTGINVVSCLKGDVSLLIVCATGAENAFNEALKLANKFKCPLLVSKRYTVEELSGKENCKLIAVTDKNLAQAVIKNIGEDFTSYSGGHKV